MSEKTFLLQKDDKVILKLHVKPNSKQQKFSYDPIEEKLTIFVKSPPDKGKANKELIKYIANILDLSSSKITLISGQTSRDKILTIEECTIDLVLNKMVNTK
ncbi:MAG: YggU family protein [Asgard group archaeon]|nr:YggU family protein [Asgard group archaeon]